MRILNLHNVIALLIGLLIATTIVPTASAQETTASGKWYTAVFKGTWTTSLRGFTLTIKEGGEGLDCVYEFDPSPRDSGSTGSGGKREWKGRVVDDRNVVIKSESGSVTIKVTLNPDSTISARWDQSCGSPNYATLKKK